jgi:hypothetical protein
MGGNLSPLIQAVDLTRRVHHTCRPTGDFNKNGINEMQMENKETPVSLFSPMALLSFQNVWQCYMHIE